MPNSTEIAKNPILYIAVILSGGGGFLGSFLSHDEPELPDMDQYVDVRDFEELEEEFEEYKEKLDENESRVYHNHKRLRTIEYEEGYALHDFR